MYFVQANSERTEKVTLNDFFNWPVKTMQCRGPHWLAPMHGHTVALRRRYITFESKIVEFT